MRRVPFLLVGDGPAELTGLGRIARDLAGLIASSDLPVDLVHVGGTVPPVWSQWRHLPLDRSAGDWGASVVQTIWRDLWGDEPGILFVVWDPGRLLPYAQLDLPAQKWTYTAVDGANVHGEISGPAGMALLHFDRVLGYGRYGANVLKATVRHPVSYLPHGLVTEVYRTPATDDEQRWARSLFGPYRADRPIIGCVATNQFRKDLGLYCQTLRTLLDRGQSVMGWLHTDVAVKAWAVQQLVEDFQLQKHIRITIQDVSDRQLAVLYQSCAVVVLPSLGEGFGYPLVEALASGTPCLHIDVAGGAELVPRTEWRVPSRGKRLEGIYAMERPIHTAEDWANAITRVIHWKETVGSDVSAAYCRGAVAHLDWTALWPRWVSWLKAGLQ